MDDFLPGASTARGRRLRRRKVERLADQQEGVVSRPQAYALGTTRWEVRANLVAGRWQRLGRQTLAVHTGEITDAALRWVAVLEGGPRAFLDGVSSLQAGGLKHFQTDTVRVSVPRGARIRRAKGVDIRQTRRWAADDLTPGPGVPRTRNDIAAIRAALWARSDKQAALILSIVVQQGLATAEELGVQMLRVRRDRRRPFIHALLLDLIGGVRSLGEREFALACRRRGIPEPSRQVVRRGRNGTYYLDVYWDEWHVVVEIDGIHHLWAQNVVGDALRQNDVTLQDAVVLRLPLLGFRIAEDEFFEQIERALMTAGWTPPPGRHTPRAS